jgi:CheY-like chemotaxis protein
MAKILLIEDDELLRDTAQQMLELDGHAVAVAEDGEAGLRGFGNGDRVDLVVTDILMPRLDGARLIAAIREISPKKPVLAISGGRRTITTSFSLETASLSGATQLLPKPFTRAQLQTAVRQLLGA